MLLYLMLSPCAQSAMVKCGGSARYARTGFGSALTLTAPIVRARPKFLIMDVASASVLVKCSAIGALTASLVLFGAVTTVPMRILTTNFGREPLDPTRASIMPDDRLEVLASSQVSLQEGLLVRIKGLMTQDDAIEMDKRGVRGLSSQEGREINGRAADIYQNPGFLGCPGARFGVWVAGKRNCMFIRPSNLVPEGNACEWDRQMCFMPMRLLSQAKRVNESDDDFPESLLFGDSDVNWSTSLNATVMLERTRH
jgi:hypothetical protein